VHHGHSGFCRCSNGHAQSTNGEMLRSLHRLARDMSAGAETPAPFLRGALASITRRSGPSSWSPRSTTWTCSPRPGTCHGPRRCAYAIQEIERERLQEILEEVGINDPVTCSEEIESLEREIDDRASQR